MKRNQPRNDIRRRAKTTDFACSKRRNGVKSVSLHLKSRPRSPLWPSDRDFLWKINLWMRVKMWISSLYLFPPGIIRCLGSAYLIFFFSSVKRKKGGKCEEENVFAWPLPSSKPNYSPASACYSRMRKKCITAVQMGTFHMTKPINHLGGTQVWHSRAATHHFTVYQAQTHGHQSMAPRGPMRRGASPQSHWFMADDFIITHSFPQRRKVMSPLITSLTTWTPTL